MPTRSGWSLLAAAAVLLATGRVFGFAELTVLGAAAVAVWAAAGAALHLRRPEVAVTRRITPDLITAGEVAHLVLTVAATRRPTGPILLREPVSGTHGALLGTDPLRPGLAQTVACPLPSGRRGAVHTGPVTVEATDPFGLWRLRTTVPGRGMLLVAPRPEPLRRPVPGRGGRDLTAGTALPASATAADGDFAHLRPYVVGDDLRRVHWPSTARRGDLVTRLDEPPGDGGVVLVLDTDPRHLDPPGFEVAVSAVASMAAAVIARGDRVEVATTDGQRTGTVSGTAGKVAIDAFLAIVTQIGDRPHRAPAAQVLVTGPEGVGADGDLVVVVEGERAYEPAAAGAGPARRVVTVPAGTSFGAAWDGGT